MNIIERIDGLLRNWRFWCAVLLATYFLPALLARIPVALIYPWVLIPNIHEGLYEFLRQCGMPSFYDQPRTTFAVAFHLAFWLLCCLLVFWGRKLPPSVLRIASVFLLLTLAITVHGCSIAIDAVRH